MVRPNLKLKTLGGKQLWSDVIWLHDWRIQQNTVSKHYRLLDPTNARHAWGTLTQCRDALGLQANAVEEKLRQRLEVPEVKRIVMLGPPNQGSRLAEILQLNPIFRLLTGETGQQIAQLQQLKKDFPTPSCEFAVVAGGRGVDVGRNPVLQGDDDLVVSVEETKLQGATDFLVVPVLHTFIMNDATVQKATRRYLEHGFLLSAEKRQPLDGENAEVAAEIADGDEAIE